MTAEDLVYRVAAARGISVLKIRGASRGSSIAHARHEAMWLLRQATELSLLEVARKLGRADHTSALFAVRKIQRAVDNDPAYGDQLRDIGLISVAAQRETVKRDVAWLTQELASRKARLKDLTRRQRRPDERAA